MSERTIRAAIETALKAVPASAGVHRGITGNAGVVQSYFPNTKRPDEFLAQFKGTDILNAWMIQRDGVEEDQQPPGRRVRVTHRFFVKGFMSRTEAAQNAFSATTEQEFHSLIEGIQNALRDDTTIWTEYPEIASRSVHALPIADTAWAGKIVHSCTLRLDVEEFIVT